MPDDARQSIRRSPTSTTPPASSTIRRARRRSPSWSAGDVEFGWDLSQTTATCTRRQAATARSGCLTSTCRFVTTCIWCWAEISVHPDHRRQGHGTAIMEEALRQAREAGRNTIWVGTAEDDLGRAGLRGDVRLRLRQPRRAAPAGARRRGPRRARPSCMPRRKRPRRTTDSSGCMPPVPEEVLAELVEVTAAINDAPMGDLTYEDEKFDLHACGRRDGSAEARRSDVPDRGAAQGDRRGRRAHRSGAQRAAPDARGPGRHRGRPRSSRPSARHAAEDRHDALAGRGTAAAGVHRDLEQRRQLAT